MKVTQSCPTLCNLMDYSMLDSSVHGILQARILEWVAVPFSGVSSQPRGQTQVSDIAGIFFHLSHQGSPKLVNLNYNWFFTNFYFLATSCGLQDLSSPTQGHGSEKCKVLTTGSSGKCLNYLFHFPISDYFWFSDFIFVLKVEGIGV